MQRRWTCESCGNTAESPAHGDEWGGMPAGWLVKRDWICNELMGEDTACSPACADAIDAKKQAEKEAEHAAYLERKRTGTMTWGDQMLETYVAMEERRQNDYIAMLGAQWSEEHIGKIVGAERVEVNMIGRLVDKGKL